MNVTEHDLTDGDVTDRLTAICESDKHLLTGQPVVDAAVARLDELEGCELEHHAQVYDDIHRALGSVLDGTSVGGPAHAD